MIHCVVCGAEIEVNPLVVSPPSARCLLCDRQVLRELETDPVRVTPVVFELGNDGAVAGFEGNF